ncbi:MAG TPA: hypothetical protein VNN10_09535 [Dehalococcoidia bacterium]|jgi:hypothetical protein|nr:hypothetical protein [Dehalococcoidia bacterium]
MKKTSRLLAHVLEAVAGPLATALRASEELMAPQLDAGCRGVGREPRRLRG